LSLLLVYVPKVFGILILLVSLSARAECPRDAHTKFDRVQLGVQVDSVLANQLPDFHTGLLLYGFSVHIPVWTEFLITEGEYGNVGNFSAYRFEAGLRHVFETPFFITFLQLTAYHLRYSMPGASHGFWGPSLGLGIALPMDKVFTIQFMTKVSFATRPLFNIGGGFLISL